MKKEMVKIYRRSSPRTSKDYDTRLILKTDLKIHLARGWIVKPPKPIEAKAKVSPVAEPEQKLSRDEIISPADISDRLKEAIKKDSGPLRAIAARHHVSFNSAQKIRAGKL
jgi:hypothetical protein